MSFESVKTYFDPTVIFSERANVTTFPFFTLGYPERVGETDTVDAFTVEGSISVETVKSTDATSKGIFRYSRLKFAPETVGTE